MKKYKSISIVFAVIAVLLSDIMCAVVAFNYCDMLYGIEYKGYSAPPTMAFIQAIPFLIGIIVSTIIAIIFYKKSKTQ